LAPGVGADDTVGTEAGAALIEGLLGADGLVSDALSKAEAVEALLDGEATLLLASCGLGVEAMLGLPIDDAGLGGVGELGTLEGVVLGFGVSCGSIKFLLIVI